MPSTNCTPAREVQRNQLSFSDERRRDGLLRSAWLKITDHFPAKPHPKSAWYETSTGDYTPWKRTIDPIRAAIQSAVQSGDKQLIEQTLQGALAFCEELKGDFASLVPAESEESILSLALSETTVEGQANPVQMALAANPNCPTAAERAIGPLSRHAATLAVLVARCRRSARQPQMRVAR